VFGPVMIVHLGWWLIRWIAYAGLVLGGQRSFRSDQRLEQGRYNRHVADGGSGISPTQVSRQPGYY